MFLLYLFQVLVMGLFFKYLFYGLITFGVCWIVYKIYHHEKVVYVLNNIDMIKKIEFIKPIQKYKIVYEETGYSYNGRYHTTHYKVKRVPKPLVYKGTAFFQNDKKVKFRIIEKSKIYNELMKLI